MRWPWVGMLFASLPLALLAQTVDRRPSGDGWFNPRSPPDSSVTVAPLPSPPPPDNAITATPLPPPDTSRPDTVTVTPAPPPDTEVPMPPDNSAAVSPDAPAPTPPDNSVTATPLPPPADNSAGPSQQLVPNPLDTTNAPPAGGPAVHAREPQRQAQRGGWVQMGTATLQALDKVNAIEKTLVVKVGATGHFDSLDIGVRGCFVRTPDVPADATAFLVIRDERADAPSFTGWMIRSAPYMSMLAHPLYDVRVAGCSP